MSAVAVQERKGPPLRCAICHDEPLPLVRCACCRSAFHSDCREALGRCPTLGCARWIKVAERRPFSWRRNLVTSLVTGGATVLLGAFVWSEFLDVTFLHDPTTEPGFRVAFAAFAILFSLHVVVLPCSWSCLSAPRGSRVSLVVRTLGAELSLGLCALLATLVLAGVTGATAAAWIVAAALFVVTPTVASYSVAAS